MRPRGWIGGRALGDEIGFLELESPGPVVLRAKAGGRCRGCRSILRRSILHGHGSCRPS